MEVDAAAEAETKVDNNEVEAEADDDLGFAGSDLFKVPKRF